MFCAHCGKELKDGARFCSVCGAPAAEGVDEILFDAEVSEDSFAPTSDTLKDTSQPQGNQAGFVEQMESDRRRSRKKLSPLMIIAIVLALLAGTAFAALFVAQQANQTGDSPANGQVDSEAVIDDSEAPDALTAEINSLNGWWRYGSAWRTNLYYFHDGIIDTYSEDGTLLATSIINRENVKRYDNGLGDQPSFRTYYEMAGYYYRDLQAFHADNRPDMLDTVSEDGAGYSGGGSLGRVNPPKWATQEQGNSSEGTTEEEQVQEAISAATSAGMQIMEGTIVVTTYADRAHEVNSSLHDFDGNYSPFILLELDEPATVTSMNYGGQNPTSTLDITNFCLNTGDIQKLSSLNGQHAIIAVDIDPYPTNRHWYSDTQGVLANCTGQFRLIMPTFARSANLSGQDYILDDSATKYYSRQELEALDNHTLFLARNEIYARHGRQFQSAELQQYFGTKAWYSGTIPPASFDEASLSNVERANANLMLEIEKGRNSPYV